MSPPPRPRRGAPPDESSPWRDTPAPTPDLIVGMGVRPGVDLEELLALIDTGLRAIAAPPTAVLALATVTLRADEPALLAAARHHGWPLLAYPPELLATVPVPHPGRASLTALGTAGVAEAACLLTPGPHRATRSGPPADPHPAD
ncbi:cobalamin biosynthesis protein, partial [Frankia canadensis]|uniref:cobalamin biosynthesis protein n=1 Tax=Frankia canadensis TaxID=1836972 RepID=UPI001FAF214B